MECKAERSFTPDKQFGEIEDTAIQTVRKIEQIIAAAVLANAPPTALDQTFILSHQLQDFFERVLHKQNEVLQLLALRNQQEYLRLANRISTAVRKPVEAPPAAQPAGVAGRE